MPTRRWWRRPWVPSTDVPDIVLASIARANQDLDQATIDKAMECYSATKCDTGTGGDVVMGYADGGGLNVWRQVTRMEAILQALTYPEIGKMLFRDAQWNPDPAVAAGDIRFLIQAGATFIIGYPDQGTNIADAILEAQAAGIPYSTYSAGWVGLPGQEGALVPGRGLPHRRRGGPLRARRELRPGDQRRGRVRQGRGHGWHTRERPVARMAAVLRAGAEQLDQDARSRRHLLGRTTSLSRRSAAGSPPTPTSPGTPTSTPMG